MMSNYFDHEIILDVYRKEILSILKICCVVFHYGLTVELGRQLESMQRLVLRLVARYLGLRLPYRDQCILFFIKLLILRRVEQCIRAVKRTPENLRRKHMFVETEKGRRRKFQEHQSINERGFPNSLSALTRIANRIS